MKKTIFAASLAASALTLASCATAQDSDGQYRTPEGAVLDVDESLAYKPGELTEAQLTSNTRDLFTADFMNVFRRFDRDRTEQMVQFYTGALGLDSLSPIQLTSTQQMILTGVGNGQIKLAAGLPEGRSYALGGIDAGTGIRYFALSYPDEKLLVDRFHENGFVAPQFADLAGGKRGAVIMDPGGFPIVLTIDRAALPGGDSGVGVGINTQDLEASRDFYRTFVGLDELEPVDDPLTGHTLYPFRNGETTIYLFHTGGELPNDDGSAGIQYIVSDAAMVDAKAKRREIAVQTPLNKLAGFDLTTIWLSDPDGVTNYYAQVGPNSRTASGQN